MRFPYLFRKQRLFPIVPITLSHQGRSFHTEGLLDSGASISVFPADIAAYIGLPLESGRLVSLIGIGGRIRGYRHEVSLTVGTTAFAAAIVFSADLISSFNLLGRDNFFEQFRITLDERRKFVELESVIQEA